MRDAARADYRAADEVDQLVLDQILRIPDRVEDFADRQRRHRMLPDQFERLLILCRGRVLEPEEPIGFQQFA